MVSQGETSNDGFLSNVQFLAEIDSDPTQGSDTQRVDVTSFTASGSPVAAGFDLIVAC